MMCCISAHTHNRNSHMRLPDGLGLDHRIGPPHQSKLHFRGWVRLKPACVLLSLISTCSVYKPWCDLLKGLFVVKPPTRANILGIGPGSCAFLSAYLWLYACVLADLPLRDICTSTGGSHFLSSQGCLPRQTGSLLVHNALQDLARFELVSD